MPCYIFCRRNSDIDCESGKKRRVNGPQKEFSRSKSLNASQERNEGVQNNGKFGQSPAKNGNKKKNEGQIDRDRDHSDEARKSNTLKNDASRSQNERNYFHALPYLGSKGQADLQMKIPKLQNRENGMESRNGRENYAARPNNRWQHMANRSREVVFRPNGPCLRPSFMQDSRFPMPLSFYPHVPLIRTSQVCFVLCQLSYMLNIICIIMICIYFLGHSRFDKLAIPKKIAFVKETVFPLKQNPAISNKKSQNSLWWRKILKKILQPTCKAQWK